MNSNNLPFNVSAGSINKVIRVPTSKSYANRLLILAALDLREVTVENVPDSTDVLTMISCLEKIGLIIRRNGNDVTIENSFPKCEHGIDPLALQTGDGGTTNRFLAAFLARGRRPYVLEPSGHMKNRPMKDLQDSLGSVGVKVESGEDFWMKIEGPYDLANEKVSVDCSKSTQFATGLLLALADENVTVETLNLVASTKYFELTQKLVSDFKNLDINYCVPIDFSSLGYPIALGATHGSVQITNFTEVDKYQADSVCVEIVKKMGAKVELNSSRLTVEAPEELLPIDIDGSGFPDLVPTLAYLCSCANGESVLRNLEILRHKECDRIDETIRILAAFGVKYEFDQNTNDLKIFGPTPLADKVEFIPPEDHRMVMVTYLFMRKNSGGELHNSHHVAKSFPDFFEIMK